jgi:hypothetical protein
MLIILTMMIIIIIIIIIIIELFEHYNEYVCSMKGGTLFD